MASIFDIVGPVMIGPSSSHTAGAARLGKMARYIFREPPVSVEMTLYGSFAKTYRGHGTDKALVGGLLNLVADDAAIRHSFELAAERGLAFTFKISEEDMGHPNVVKFSLKSQSGREMTVVGRSLGGGRILVTEIEGLSVEITGDEHTILTFHQDQPGIIAHITAIISERNINISRMRVFRKQKYSQAVMMIHVDSPVDRDMLRQMEDTSAIHAVMYFEPL